MPRPAGSPDSARKAGILLHPTSLPSPDLGSEGLRFIDFLVEAGQSLWQMLPVGPTDAHNSPYAARSAFAGDPMLISAEWLASSGLLAAVPPPPPAHTPPHMVDFPARRAHQEKILREAYGRFAAAGRMGHLDAFEAAHPWLRTYALFAALRDRTGEPWWHWKEEHAHPECIAVPDGSPLQAEVDFQRFLQFVFDDQWRRLKEYAGERGIQLWGDLPIFVDRDSADVWANPHLYKLDGQGNPISVSGVPPDAFSETGQRWGNPVYDWDAHAREGYRWWVERLRTAFDRFDAVRIDHFRGFEAAWEIPAGDETAMGGRWVPGPGARLFEVLAAELGALPIVVEDLGIITDEVRGLRDTLGYPGMAVLQFAFEGGGGNPYLPRNQVENSVVFTGTHDNDTTLGWWESLPESHRHVVRTELGIDGSDIVDDLVRTAYRSSARTAIIPMQDVLKLGGEARMNQPARIDGNWGWRFDWEQIPPGRSAWLRSLAMECGRLPA